MTRRASSTQRPVVGVWRDVVLPLSETWIANQLGAMRHWTGSLAGLRRSEAGTFDLQPALVIDDLSPARARVERSLLWHTGVSPAVVRWMRSTHVVHAHFGPDATKIMRSAAMAKRPLVVTFHGYDITMSKVVAEYPYGELFRRASSIIAVSDHIRDKLLLAGAAPGKVDVAHIGIPLPPDRKLQAAEADVLFVGRLIEKKGPGDLLQAAAKLRRPPRITIVGDGHLRRGLEAQAAQAGLDARFLGAQPFSRVDMEMRRHRLLCAPSRPAANGDSEGLPMVFLEAAARRLPIVSYRSAGVNEAVEDGRTGLLAPEGDVDALAALLDQALGDSELRERLGEAGRARVEAQFDINSCTTRIEAIYDKAKADTLGPAVGSTYLGGRA